MKEIIRGKRWVLKRLRGKKEAREKDYKIGYRRRRRSGCKGG